MSGEPLSSITLAILLGCGVVILLFGLAKLVYVPLSLIFEARAARQRRRGRLGLLAERPTVSVIVPGYNEETVLRNCVESILGSRYPLREIVLVDDGSTDGTAAIMAELAERHERVVFIRKRNAGKGAALNTGLRHATGEVLLLVDADGVFAPETVERILAGFTDPGIGAVCGDDRPVNLDRVQTQLLTVISHIGTGLVRRALSVLRCMPIVSGNIGAFRRDVLDRTGPLNEQTIGEDLELTWRIYRAGFRVEFAPLALVFSESPSTVAGLWKQRVRWARGLLQTQRIHRGMIGNPRHGVFGAFLVFNLCTMVLVPVLQLLVVAAVPLFLFTEHTFVPHSVLGVLGLLGLITAALLAIFSIAMNRAWSDLRYLWTLPLWPVYSLFVGASMATAIVQELIGRPAKWNKLSRTGVVSVRSARRSLGARRTAGAGAAR